MRTILLINKMDICINVSDYSLQAIVIQWSVSIKRRNEIPELKNYLTWYGIYNTDFHLVPEVWKHITTSQYDILVKNLGKAETLHTLISLEVHLEPILCIVCTENYHPHPSNWQVSKVCLKSQVHIAVSLVSQVLLSWIWYEASRWTLLQMPSQQTLLSRTRLTS